MKNILGLIKNNQKNPVIETPDLGEKLAENSVGEVIVEDESRAPEEIKQADNTDDDLYSIKNFSIYCKIKLVLEFLERQSVWQSSASELLVAQENNPQITVVVF